MVFRIFPRNFEAGMPEGPANLEPELENLEVVPPQELLELAAIDGGGVEVVD